MVLSQISSRGCFSFSFLNTFHRKFNTQITSNSILKFQKYFRWNRKRFSSASFSTANAHAYEESNVDTDVKDPKGIDFLNLMEERGIRANSETFLWLLDGCLQSSRNLKDGKKLHAKMVKLGFDREDALCKLMDVYIAISDLNGAYKLFDEMPERTVFHWNKMISGFSAKKVKGRALSVYIRMVMENVEPNEATFVGVLKACSGGNVSLDFVEQVHALIIHHGLGTSSLVCNPLLYLYSKNGLIDSAKKVFQKLDMKDIVSWVAMISGLSQNECEVEAVLLFRSMHTSRIFPTPYVFSSVLSACTKMESFEIGHQVHGLVYKLGFSSETYVCNALVTLYSRSGEMTSSEQIFRQMWVKDAVTYNSLISGLAQCGIADRAMRLFEEMQHDFLKPDCITVASLLSACASIGNLLKGQQLHSYVIKSGISSDIIIEGSLLDLYVKCSELETARKYFLTTETENVVLWNVMLVAYGQLDDLIESVAIFRQMLLEGIRPNQFTYPSILRTCTMDGALHLGEQIHTQVIKTGFHFNVYVCSVLIDMYAKLKKLDTAREILRRHAAEDVVSWTAMISGYTLHGFFSDALKVFNEMLTRGIRSDNIGFSSAISACAGLKALNQGRQIHAQSYISGYIDDQSIGNALVSLYARSGRTQEAYLAFEKIEAKDDNNNNNISWNSLISGFAQSGYCEEALRVFSRMNKAGVEMNMFTFGSALSAAGNTANVKQGKQIHSMIIKKGYDSEIEVSNVLITLYAKCGGIDDARRQFFEMCDKNEISWNAMITAYSQHGCGNEALNLFEKMKRVGLKPNHVTFVGVLSACSHVGLVNECFNYFDSMKQQHGLVPKPEHYVCIVDLLGRAGFIDRAKKFIDDMPIEPDSVIWRTLLSACIVHKNIEIGEFAAHRLLELEPEDSATYVLLSNIYAVSGRWGGRDRTRRMMKERGVKKEPGRSWIEVNNSIHAFFVGDELHPQVDKIYEYLRDLNKRVGEIGYVHDRFSLLSEVEQGKKDRSLRTHSEKLAITFGLFNLPHAFPIRVIKNLRVCNDCHNWIKFVSKVSKRGIVVRDAYRFHHFQDGVCSCRDYW